MLIQQADFPIAAALFAGAFLSIYFKKLTISAAIIGFFCGFIIYIAAGYTALFCMAAFFICGTLATARGRKAKQSIEKPDDHTQRKYSQVLANAGAAAIFASLILVFPAHYQVFSIMLAASLASATSDTLSSELGMLYGKTFYNCISWKREERGLDGAVSLEGTLIGLIGAALIASIYAMGIQLDRTFFIIITAGFAGNLSDSVFGATLERHNLLNNDWVNFLSTLFAAAIAGLIYLI